MAESKAGKYHVALALNWQFTFGWRVIRGILDYAESRTDWQIVTPFLRADLHQIYVNRARIDGLLTDLMNEKALDLCNRLECPIVDIGNLHMAHPFPRVHSDEREIGRMAARYFFQSGYRNFAFCGYHQHAYSEERQVGFASALSALGTRSIEVFNGTFAENLVDESLMDALRAWVRKLPKPVALFACSDLRAIQLCEACRAESLRVPVDVSILGVDNEEQLMRLYGHEISSIEQNAEAIGREGAHMLDQRMRAHRESTQPGPDQVLLQPVRVMTRDTTRTLVPADPCVARAITAMRRDIDAARSIESIARESGVSWRTLQRRFRNATGISPKEYMMQLKLERAQTMLREGKLGIGEIADRLGFEEPRRLTMLFRSELGITPRDYRRRHSDKPR